ncbi:hypothetical protein [Fulvivirga lutea]|uniref:Uncharacterized protein n=1 Tax=Fulvivirga lutea TaxID=2810512 RepID=A0A974WEI0_9BACT|nr:hypothetical protein [Fulvivirga lutea]QSE96616.1 hypothetical protein JR347_13560 [Fulvivirga lutea]
MTVRNLLILFVSILLITPFTIMESIILLKKTQVKREIKHELMRSIPKNELTLITLSQEEARTKLRWEHSKEFEFDGAMFDVVYTEEHDNKISYWCWPDTEESSLNQLLKSLTKQKHQSTDDEGIKLQKILTYTIPTSTELISLVAYELVNETELDIHYQSIDQCPITPPPNS